MFVHKNNTEITMLGSQRQKEQKYWLNKLSGELVKSTFSYDYAQTDIPGYHIKTLEFRLEEELFSQLIAASKGSDIKLNMILTTGLVILLWKYTGNRKIILGTSVLKQKTEAKFINTVLALCNKVDSRMTFKELLLQVRETVIEATENQNFPIKALLHRLNMPFKENDFPLFDIVIILKNIQDKEYVRHIRPNVIFTFFNTGESIEGEVEYNSARYSEMKVNQIIAHFINIMREGLSDAGVKVCDIKMLSAEEKRQILQDFNNTGSDGGFKNEKTVHQVFAGQAGKLPDHMAVICEEQQLTYKALNKKANQLADVLRERGVCPDRTVGIMVERSVVLIVGILGILKAGGAYLPIDGEYPDTRIRFMMEDGEIKWIVTQDFFIDQKRDIFGQLPSGGIISIDKQAIYKSTPSGRNEPTLNSKGEDMAYVIYTSGSTGKPKGVVVEHRNLVNLVYGLHERIYKRYVAGRNVGLVSPYMFDASVKQIFAALLLGHCLHVVSEKIRIDGSGLLGYYRCRQVEISDGTPTHLRLFIEGSSGEKININVKHFIIGGEPLQRVLVERFFDYFTGDAPTITNVYGPTECSVDSTSYEITGETAALRRDIPIGIPMPNYQVYILNKAMQLLPPGVDGEICISGAGVARGYLKRDQLTAEKFVENPFFPDSLLYRTGDLGRWLPDGNIEFSGRLDNQVKIRGFRVELGEIESLLLEHEEIEGAVVIARETADGDKYLCSFIVSSTRSFEHSELKEYLSKKVPDYLIPLHFEQLDNLPLTSNGKVDRQVLSARELKRKSPGMGFEAPGDAVEEKLVELWSELLEVEKESISVSDNFFELGGHSLKAVILGARVHKIFNVKVSLAEIFKSSILRELAELIKGAVTYKFFSIRAVEKKEYYPLSSAQRRMFILQQMDLEGSVYNIPAAMKLEGDVNKEKFEGIFQQLIQRHESFRTSFLVVDDRPVQRIHDKVEFEVEYYLATEDTESTEASHHSSFIIHHSFIRPFNLSHAPLMRLGLIKTVTQEHILMVDMHHIISDGISTGIIIKEFMDLQAEKKLPGLRFQYKNYSQWHNGQVGREYLEEQRAYWLKQFEEEVPVLDLPLDYSRPLIQSFEGHIVHFEMNKEETAALKSLAREQNITLFMLLLSVYTVFLCKLSGQEDIVVGTPTAGRRHTDLEGIIGMFVNTLPLRNFPVMEKTFGQFLKEVGENTIKAFENQDYLYEDLVEEVVIERDVGRNPLFDTVFALQNMHTLTIELPGLKVNPYHYESRISKFDLTLTAVEIDDCLAFTFEYCTNLFKKETIQRFIAFFKKTISTVLVNHEIRLYWIEIITGEEKNRILLDFNDTRAEYPLDKTIHQLFEEQVEKRPNQVALVGPKSQIPNPKFQTNKPFGQVNAFGGNISITYRELNNKSDQLAYLLKEKGAGADTIVGIMVERSIELIIGILGILKAGGAYLPIDPAYPQERIQYILNDSKVKILLTGKDLAPSSPSWLNASLFHHSSFSVQNSNNLAYVIYTSGSTGKPKGTLIQHRSLVNRLNWMQRFYPLGKDDVILQKTTFTFDVSVWELLWWGITGAGVYLLKPGDEKDPGAIAREIRRQCVTTIHFVPSMLKTFLDYVSENISGMLHFRTLRQVFSSGEALSTAQVEQFNRRLNKENGTRLINLYGPTEATIDVSYFNCTGIKTGGETLKTIPIGKPIENTWLYILDRNMRLQPVGLEGELFIGGIGLARGYLNKPELTSERFVHPSPFALQPSSIYKTGDLARWLPDGNIEFLGRMDLQVKIRGFRIELGEIENQLLDFAPVKEVVVVDNEDNSGDKRLTAYIVPDPEYAYPVQQFLKLKRQGVLSDHQLYELPNGLTLFYLNRNETDFMYREIFEDQSYLQHGIKLSEGACIFDVGANIGVFSLFAHQICKDAKIYSFEPIPPVYEVLELNTSLYGVDVKLFQCGISSVGGEAVFTYYPHNTVLSGCFADTEQEMKTVKAFINNQQLMNKANDRDSVSGDQVQELLEDRLSSIQFKSLLKTLSQIIEEDRIERIDLLKIDVEKSEVDVLLGVNEEDWPKIKQMVIEVHNVDGRLDKIIELLESHGYKVSVDQDRLLDNTELYNVYAVQPGKDEVTEGNNDRLEERSDSSSYCSLERLKSDACNFLRAGLPEYMIPSVFVLLEAIPLTSNNKIDRKSLLSIETVGIGREYTVPKDEVEKKLVEIWSGILAIEKEKISIDANFFHLGGHSLKATALASMINKEFNVTVPLNEIFKTPFIRRLAIYIKKSTQGEYISIEKAEKKEYHELSSAQKGLFILEKTESGLNTAYNLPTVMLTRGNLDKLCFERAIHTLVKRHESLRTSFELKAGKAVQIVHDDVDFKIKYSSIQESDSQREISTSPLKDEITRTIVEFIKSFDISKPPLLRIEIVELSEKKHILLFDMHHIVSDGVSMGILVREFIRLYEGSMLPALRIQYKDFSEWQNELFESEVIKKQEDYWLNRFKGDIPVLKMKTDFPRPSVKYFEGDVFTLEIDETTTDKVKQMMSETGTTLFQVLLAMYNILLSKYTQQEDIIVGVPIAGRNHADLESIIGMFVNTLAIRIYQRKDLGFLEFLAVVKKSLVEAYENQDYPLEELVKKLEMPKDLSRNPLFDVLFVSENLDIPKLSTKDLEFLPYESENKITHLDLVLYFVETNNRIQLKLEYSTRLFKDETARAILEHYIEIVEQIVDNHGICLKDIVLSHDFSPAHSVVLQKNTVEFAF